MSIQTEKLIQSSLLEASILLTQFMEHPDTVKKMTKIATIIQSIFEKRGVKEMTLIFAYNTKKSVSC